jgi:hypothetical protein
MEILKKILYEIEICGARCVLIKQSIQTNFFGKTQ